MISSIQTTHINRSRLGRSQLLACVTASVLVSGCAFRTQATGMAVDHNDFVAETTNSQTVLNILRAREREPMHFTSFTKVAGNISAIGAFNTNITLNGDGGSTTRTESGPFNSQATTEQDVAGTTLGATNVTPQVSLTVNTGTSFDIAVNADDEFYKGILGPLPDGLLVHYLRQGYPADLLSHLAIGRIEFFAEVKGPDNFSSRKLLLDLRNAPDEADQATVFADAMKCRHLSYATSARAAKSLPLSSPEALSGIAPELVGRLKVKEAEEAKRTASRYSLETPARNGFAIALSEPTDKCDSIRQLLDEKFKNQSSEKNFIKSSGTRGKAQTITRKLEQTNFKSVPQNSDSSLRDRSLDGQGGATFESKNFFQPFLKQGYEGDLTIEISFRSIEGVLYYLGEYARNGENTPLLRSDNCPNKGYCLPILRIVESGDLDRSRQWVNVNYRGIRYSVPLSGAKLDAVGGRSSQTISLVQQLLNLTKTAKELPSTPSVRIVN